MNKLVLGDKLFIGFVWAIVLYESLSYVHYIPCGYLN
jgi:hypothetical protein